MRGTAEFCLLLAAAGLLGMAAPPDRVRDAKVTAVGSEAEDEALIADLDCWEEQAIAEYHDFLQFLEVLQDVLPEKPAATPEEAK